MGGALIADARTAAEALQQKRGGARSRRLGAARRLATNTLPELVAVCSSASVGPRVVCGNSEGTIDGENAFFSTMASLLVSTADRRDDDTGEELSRALEADRHTTHLLEMSTQHYLRSIMAQSETGAGITCSLLLPALSRRWCGPSKDAALNALRLAGEFTRLYLREGMMHSPMPEMEARMRELLSTTLFPQCERLLTEASPIAPQITLRLLFDIINFKPNYASLFKTSGIAGTVLAIVDSKQSSEPPVLAVALVSKMIASSRIDPLEFVRGPYYLLDRIARVLRHIHGRLDELHPDNPAFGESTAAPLLEHAIDILDETLLRVVEVDADISKALAPIVTQHSLDLLAMAAGPSEGGSHVSTRCKAAACLSGLIRVCPRAVHAALFSHDGFAKAFRHIGDALREKEGESTSARRSGGSDDDEGDEGRASIDSLQRTILGFLRRIADGHGISSTERTRVRSCLRSHAHLWGALLDMQRYAVDESISELAEDVLQLAL